MNDNFQELLDLGNRIKKRDRISILVAVVGVILTILLYGTPYFLIGLYATKLGEAWRLTGGADASTRILRLKEGFAAAFY